jgi:hypothetical protein
MLALRKEAWGHLGKCQVKLGVLRDVDPQRRKRIDELSRCFRESGRLIVEELQRRGQPALIVSSQGEPIELRLTRDSASFVVLEPGSDIPAWQVNESEPVAKSSLYDYAAACPN